MYYVIRKNVEGIYLLDSRNVVIEKTQDKDIAKKVFDEVISNKKANERYVMFNKPENGHRLQICWER